MLINENKYDNFLKANGQKYGVDWLLLKAQVKQESKFNPIAESHAGAKGLAQFMPGTWDEWGEKKNVYDPEANLDAQARYMKWLLRQLEQPEKALAAYNWGIGNVKKLIKNNPGKSFNDLINLLPKETKGYIRNILAYWEVYKKDKAIKPEIAYL